MGGGKKAPKLTSKEKKNKQNEELRPYVEKLAFAIDDFGAGFHKPTMKDLFVFKMVVFPYHFGKASVWQLNYWVRRLQGKELSDDERSVLTERAVGNVAWEFANEEERTAMISKELWKLDNLKKWNEEQELKKMSKTERKQYEMW